MRGETLYLFDIVRLNHRFQSTLPVRGETEAVKIAEETALFQSTLPVRGETLYFKGFTYLFLISIHSPRAGRDIWFDPLDMLKDISIHSPRAGRDTHFLERQKVVLAFQSTLPVRGETQPVGQTFSDLWEFQSTLPVRGETRAAKKGES